MDPETLHDLAFGTASKPRTGSVFFTRVDGQSGCASDVLLVITTIGVLILVLSYTSCKALEYHELFQRNTAHHTGLLVFNAVAVLCSFLTVLYATRVDQLYA